MKVERKKKKRKERKKNMVNLKERWEIDKNKIRVKS
jgi:hypothetical protein